MRFDRFGLSVVIICVSLAIGASMSHVLSPISAQSITSAPWLSIAGPFDFFYRYPDTIGWSSAEDKRGDPYVKGWKIDVDRGRADCLHWTAVGAVPAALLSRETLCTGGVSLTGGIYWFDAPPGVPPTPSTPSPPVSPVPPTATDTPQAGATATRTPAPAVTGTPGPGIPLPTLSPAQLRAFTVSCNPPGSPLQVTIHSSYSLVVGVDRGYCGPLYVALIEFLEQVSRMTPATVEVSP